MDSLIELKNAIDSFAEEREWCQFHTPANLAKSISIEANELLECFQWDENNYDINDVSEELADVFNYCIRMASVLNIDVYSIIMHKLEKNVQKYPVEKFKGISTKYNKL